MQRMVFLMLTYSCNLNCIYCYQKHKTSQSMSLETAKTVVAKEVALARQSENKEGIRLNLFGGEPFLKFELMKDLCDWIWNNVKDVKIDIYITTNGTLLNDEKKEWLEANKDRINIIMSVDGADDVQECNRGCDSSKLPIKWILDTLPNRFLSMTVSRESLGRFADELINFHNLGYHVEAKPAQGEDWQPGDGKVYEEQLERIAEYYLSHPQINPIYLFKELSYVHLLNNEPNEKYGKTCDAGDKLVAYDVEGRLFPCHHFLPNVNGRSDVLSFLDTIDFSDNSTFIDKECQECAILKLCRTCCARNYNERGDLRKRDKRACQIMLAEAKVVSSYQIRKNMANKDSLTPQELLQLKAAVKCYELCCNFEKEFYK